jgi:tripeptide aminopeptidase
MWRATPLLIVLASAGGVAAQERAWDIGERLLQDSTVQSALDAARRLEPQTIADQVRICEIPAPPFKEARRAAAYKQMFEELGLQNVRIDAEGNVLGERPGLAPRPHVVFSAHLDTVFPEGTDVRVTRDGSLLRGPGIGDDCRGLAVVLAVARALDAANLQTPGTITFVGTVGEEGLGDLRGVRHLFDTELGDRVDRFVSVDGTGLGITHVAVGSRRYRIAFTGLGGHSYSHFGIANPVHALGRTIARMADVQVPMHPRTTFSVGRIGGGTSVNTIAAEAWMEVDLRSADADTLTAVERRFLRAVDDALAAENARWKGRGRLSVVREQVGDRPAGRLPPDAPIVQAAVSVTRALGLPVSLDEGSTDANYPLSLGIPAIAIDGGGRGSGAHTLEETFETANSWHGTQRATLLAIALAH